MTRFWARGPRPYIPSISSADSINELTGDWRTPQSKGVPVPTQELGRSAFDVDTIQALRYESAQNPGHATYVIFTDRLVGKVFVEVNDPDNNLRERLP